MCLKKILAFWVCYIAGLFIAEGLVILLYFALGKNMLVGDVFDAGTILHSFWNAILYSVLGLNLSGNEEALTAIFNMQSVGDNIWNGSTYGIEASVATTVVLAFVTALFLV